MNSGRTPIIYFITLDENIHDKNYANYQKLTAEQKIDFVEQRIITICEELKKWPTDAMWIIAWREYGIDEGVGKRAISPQAKNKLKTTLSQLTQKYPNLTIVAGTVQTYKHVTDPLKLQQIETYYSQHVHVAQEDKVQRPNEQYVKKEKANIRPLKKNFPATGIDVVRNSCFVFSADKIWCHDKSAPVVEVVPSVTKHLNNALFQPAKRKNASPVCTLVHPVTRGPVRLGIEICNEHWMGVLKHRDPRHKTFLHLVLSDSITITRDHCHGEYIIQLDSVKESRLVLLQNQDPSTVPVLHFRANMYDIHCFLRGPVAPSP